MSHSNDVFLICVRFSCFYRGWSFFYRFLKCRVGFPKILTISLNSIFLTSLRADRNLWFSLTKYLKSPQIVSTFIRASFNVIYDNFSRRLISIMHSNKFDIWSNIKDSSESNVKQVKESLSERHTLKRWNFF